MKLNVKKKNLKELQRKEVSLEKDKTYLVAGGYPTDTFRPTKMWCPPTVTK